MMINQDLMDLTNLFVLANQMEEVGFWKISLLPREYERLTPLLRSYDEFNHFMNASNDNDAPTLKEDTDTNIMNESVDLQNFNFIGGVRDDVLFQFRLRSVISEYLIKTILFPNKTPAKDLQEKIKKYDYEINKKKLAMNVNLYIPMDDIIYSLEIDDEDWKSKEEIREQFLKYNNVSTDELNLLSQSLILESPVIGRTKTQSEKNLISKKKEAIKLFYDSLSLVLQKLKDYKEHSGPFISKVKENEAPDYYLIIKKPMYLNLMTYKLTKKEYKNKQQFQQDLDLIWENCRTFNTDHSSKIFVIHSNAMEKRAAELMQRVLDLPPEYQNANEDDMEDEEPVHNPSEMRISAPKQEIAKQTKDLDYYLVDVDKLKSEARSSEFIIQDLRGGLDKSAIVLRNDEEKYAWDVQSKLYAQETRAFRLSHMAYRNIQRKLPFAERDSITRDEYAMKRFSKSFFYNKPIFNYDLSSLPVPVNYSLPHFLPELIYPSSSFPLDPFPLFSSKSEKGGKSEKKRSLAQLAGASKKPKMDIIGERTDVFISNVEQSIVRRNLEKSIYSMLSGEQEETYFDKFLSHLEHPSVYSKDSDEQNQYSLKRSIALLLMHEGYDSITNEALKTLMDVYTSYVMKMATSLNHLRDFSENNDYINLAECISSLDNGKSSPSQPFQQLLEYIDSVESNSDVIQKDIEHLRNEIERLRELREKNPEQFQEEMYKEEIVPDEEEIVKEEPESSSSQPTLPSPSIPLSNVPVAPTPVPPPTHPHTPSLQSHQSPTGNTQEEESKPTPPQPPQPPSTVVSKKRRGRPPGKKNTNYK